MPEQVAEWRRRLESGDIPARQREKLVEEEKKRQAEHARRKHEEQKQKRWRKLNELARFGWQRRQEMWSQLRQQTDEATAAAQFAER